MASNLMTIEQYIKSKGFTLKQLQKQPQLLPEISKYFKAAGDDFALDPKANRAMFDASGKSYLSGGALANPTLDTFYGQQGILDQFKANQAATQVTQDGKTYTPTDVLRDPNTVGQLEQFTNAANPSAFNEFMKMAIPGLVLGGGLATIGGGLAAGAGSAATGGGAATSAPIGLGTTSMGGAGTLGTGLTTGGAGLTDLGLAGAGMGGTGTAAATGGALGAADLASLGLTAPTTGPLATGGAAAMGVGSAAAPAAAGGLLSSLNNTLGTNVTGGSLASGLLQGGLGYLGANQQADAIQDVANQNLALGAPYRDLLGQSYGQDFDLWSQPGYEDALTRAADISSRSWSAKAGNPAGNPTAQAGIYRDVLNEAFLPAMSNYRGQLGQFGGLGLNTSGQAQLMGAQQAGSGLDAIGYGVGTALNPQPDWAKILQGGSNSSPFSLNIGGIKWGN